MAPHVAPPTGLGLLLVAFPFVAVPAYLVFGRDKFEGMADAFNARQDESALEAGFQTRCTWLLPMRHDSRIDCLNCEPLTASISERSIR